MLNKSKQIAQNCCQCQGLIYWNNPIGVGWQNFVYFPQIFIETFCIPHKNKNVR
jgi:hypothetical protein